MAAAAVMNPPRRREHPFLNMELGRPFVKRRAGATAEVAGWVLFRRTVPWVGREQAGRYPSSAHATVAFGAGNEVTASVALGCPPMLSLALVVAGQAVRTAGPWWAWPSLLAADEDRILIQVPNPPASVLLVFKAHPQVATLDVLPQRVPPRALPARGTGLLSAGDDYVVASMDYRYVPVGELEVATVTIYRSSSQAWTVRHIPLPGLANGNVVNRWTPDATFSYHHCICFVDYARCILVCDVLSDEPGLIQVDLPPCAPATPRQIAQGHWNFRAVTASQNLVKFMDVDARPGVDDICINVWALDVHGYIWTQQGGIRVSCRPQLPQFPVLSGNDADVVHFLVPHAPGDRYLYSVNWMTGELISKFRYIEEDVRVARPDTPYVGSYVAQYVKKPPVKAVAFPDTLPGACPITSLENHAPKRKAKKD
ncbi:hypothetical protein ACP70R_002766 [Stipagrostis hirtigluma subsp. patula]